MPKGMGYGKKKSNGNKKQTGMKRNMQRQRRR
jgi:hypothetical protein